MQPARSSQSGKRRARCFAACLVQARTVGATAASSATTLPSGSPRPLPAAHCLLTSAAGIYPEAWQLPLDATDVRRAQRAQHAALHPPSGFGQQVVGRRLAHYWELDDAWYCGALVACNPGCAL